MDKEIETRLTSPALRSALRAYAERLHRVLGDMGTLSGTGIALDRQFHATISLEACEPEAERLAHWRKLQEVPDSSGFNDHRPAPAMAEAAFLQTWLDGPPRPLLLLAPFGSGKSVLLETFALAQAERLLDADRFYAGQLPPLVPLPVRLRAWQWKETNDAGEDFRSFLHRSQTVVDFHDDEGLLTSDDLRLLLKAKRLVPLFDGFDELPGAYTSGSGRDPRSEALQAIKTLCRGSHFALTSRPGYGAEQAFQGQEIHTIRELRSAEVEAFVRARFHATGPDRETDALSAFREVHSTIEQALRRPLFLAAWCDRIAAAPASPPQGIGVLMEGLLAKAFDPRRMQEETVTANRLLAERSLLASILLPFAEGSFSAVLSVGTLEARLTEHPLLSNADTRERLMRWLTKAGLLAPVGETEYFAFKVPLTEYLVGWHLADMAAQDVGRREMTGIFRSWIWQPAMHDALDYAFDTLWKGSAEQRDFAAALLEWAVAVVKHDSVQSESVDPPAQDDLVRSFAVAALRWHALNTKPDRRAIEAATIVAPSLAVIVARNIRISKLLAGPALAEFILQPLLDGFFGKYALARDEERGRWSEAIDAVALRVREIDAPRLVQDWIIRRNNADRTVKETWTSAIRSAASRVSEIAAPRLVEDWSQLHCHDKADSRDVWQKVVYSVVDCINEASAPGFVERSIEHHELAVGDAKEHWKSIISVTAERVSESVASSSITTWIKRHALASDHTKEAWLAAIISTCSRVSEKAAANTLYELLRRYDELGSEGTWQWREAIAAVGGRLSEAAAYEVVQYLSRRYNDHDMGEWHWLSAIEAVASRVSHADAPKLIEHWIALHNDRYDREELRWHGVIEAAGPRISEDDALRLIGDWTKRYQQDNAIKSAWTCAIGWAVRRANETDATKLLKDVIPLYENANRTLKVHWGGVMEAVASRVSEATAPMLVQDWIARPSEADELLDTEWELAIEIAAKRVCQTSIPNLIEDWIKLLRQTAGRTKELWKKAIAATGSQALEKDATNVSNMLINVGMFDAAFKLAETRTSVAIINQSAECDRDEKVKALEKALPFVAKLRSELILDGHLAALPNGIREILKISGAESANGNTSGELGAGKQCNLASVGETASTIIDFPSDVGSVCTPSEDQKAIQQGRRDALQRYFEEFEMQASKDEHELDLPEVLLAYGEVQSRLLESLQGKRSHADGVRNAMLACVFRIVVQVLSPTASEKRVDADSTLYNLIRQSYLRSRDRQAAVQKELAKERLVDVSAMTAWRQGFNALAHFPAQELREGGSSKRAREAFERKLRDAKACLRDFFGPEVEGILGRTGMFGRN